MTPRLIHLRMLEAESIHILREVAAEFARPVMLYSIGKDSSVMLRLAQKAFHPGKIPFPLLHVDTSYKFREMIEFRDRYTREIGATLIVHQNRRALEGKSCVVIGGGTETEQRVRALIEAGAQVTLIAPAVPEAIAKLASEGRIRWNAREYQPGDIEGAFLAVACPGNRSRNAEIWAEAEARGTPLNATDDGPHCSFIFPAIHRQGDLVVAVSSGGKSPALASRIRDRIAPDFGPEVAEFLDLLGQLRPEVTERFPAFERRREIWYRLVDSEALGQLQAGRREDALAALRNILEHRSAGPRA